MNASMHVIELIRKKISNEFLTASDTDVARVLGVSRAIVSSYRREKVMSAETLEKAQEILQLPPGELWDVSTALMLEATPETKAVNAAHQWMRDQAKRWGGAVAKGFALAIVAAGMVFAPAGNQAHASVSTAAHTVHYAPRRRRRSGGVWARFARFFTIFPVAVLATGCSALRTPEEQTWLALHAIDSAQTYRIAQDDGRCYHEADPITSELIGRFPSRSNVVAWSVGSAAVHAGVTEVLLRAEHPRLAKAWQYLTIGVTGSDALRNYQIGIRIGAHNEPTRGCVR